MDASGIMRWRASVFDEPSIKGDEGTTAREAIALLIRDNQEFFGVFLDLWVHMPDETTPGEGTVLL
jgi:hypothetical protein